MQRTKIIIIKIYIIQKFKTSEEFFNNITQCKKLEYESQALMAYNFLLIVKRVHLGIIYELFILIIRFKGSFSPIQINLSNINLN